MGNVQAEQKEESLSLHLRDSDLESFEKGKDELNLAEFPIAVVAESAQPGQLTLEFSDTINDRSTGAAVERRVTVHGTEEWGLPAAQDDDVMVGLLQLCHIAGWPKKICFTRYQLCKLLRWSVGGASYRRIYQALHRLSTTTYNYRYGWRDKANQEWIPSLVFSYIQSLKIHEADKPTKSGLCEVTWSDDFHRSLETGNLKGLDFNRFVSLRSSIAKRLYRFLDKRFGIGMTRYSCDLRVLAFEKIGISRKYKDAAQIKRVLQSAIHELEAAGFLQQARPQNRYEKIQRGQWKIHFIRASQVSKKKKVIPLQLANSPVEDKLIKLGIIPSEVKKFVAEYSVEYLEEKIDQFPFRDAKTNPAGFLAESIRRDMPPPPNYLPQAERLQQEKLDQQRARKRAKLEQAEQAKIRAEKAAEEKQFAEAETVFKSLSQQEQNALEQKAKNQFPTSGSDVIYWTMISHLKDRLSNK